MLKLFVTNSLQQLVVIWSTSIFLSFGLDWKVDLCRRAGDVSLGLGNLKMQEMIHPGLNQSAHHFVLLLRVCRKSLVCIDWWPGCWL